MKQLLKFSLLLIVVFGCHRDKVDYLGPAYVFAPDGFEVTDFTAAPDPVNFNSGPKKITFNATFTNNVSWILTLKGRSSGAEHIMRGISQGLDNVDWTGNHDGVNFFRKGEFVDATLSFYGTDYTNTIDFKITSPPNFGTCGQFPSFGDFEMPTFITHANGWHAFDDPTPIPNVEQAADSGITDRNGNIVKACQGYFYYYIKGKGNQDVFVSGIQYDKGAFMTPQTPSDPNNVWVNMYIYGTGDPNAGVELEYQEEDFDGTSAGYNGKDDDAFTAKFSLTHTGWKLFSFKYSSLTPSLNADFGGSGNHIHEPDKLRSFDLVLVKKTDKNSPIEVFFDYPIITVGGPFKPCR